MVAKGAVEKKLLDYSTTIKQNKISREYHIMKKNEKHTSTYRNKQHESDAVMSNYFDVEYKLFNADKV